MDHIGIVVDDLTAATAFFTDLGLKRKGEDTVEGTWVDRVLGLEGVWSEIAMLETPDGHSQIELTKFHNPSSRPNERQAAANTRGIRHIAFAVDDIDATRAALQGAGVKVSEPNVIDGVGRQSFFKDPCGNLVEINEPAADYVPTPVAMSDAALS